VVSLDQMHLSRDRDKKRALVNMVMNLRVTKWAGNFLLPEWLLAPQKNSAPWS
jgi:hypothetical protein